MGFGWHFDPGSEMLYAPKSARQRVRWLVHLVNSNAPPIVLGSISYNPRSTTLAFLGDRKF